jgi:hypothetical protein
MVAAFSRRESQMPEKYAVELTCKMIPIAPIPLRRTFGSHGPIHLIFQALSHAIRGPGLYFDARDGDVRLTVSNVARSGSGFTFDIEVNAARRPEVHPALKLWHDG